LIVAAQQRWLLLSKPEALNTLAHESPIHPMAQQKVYSKGNSMAVRLVVKKAALWACTMVDQLAD
jgi:hypothetical protein